MILEGTMLGVLAQKFVCPRAREARDLGASLVTRLDEVFHGILQIKMNAAEGYHAKQYTGLIKTQVRTIFGSAAIPAMIDIMSSVCALRRATPARGDRAGAFAQHAGPATG